MHSSLPWGRAMNSRQIFALEIAGMVLLFVLIARWYWSPRLAPLPLRDALTPLLLLHLTRVLGLTMLVPGVIDTDLPRSFAVPGAYGDLIAAVLALVGHRGAADEAPQRPRRRLDLQPGRDRRPGQRLRPGRPSGSALVRARGRVVHLHGLGPGSARDARHGRGTTDSARTRGGRNLDEPSCRFVSRGNCDVNASPLEASAGGDSAASAPCITPLRTNRSSSCRCTKTRKWNTPSSAKAFIILSMLVDRRRKRFDGCAAWTCIILSRLNDLVLEVRLPPGYIRKARDQRLSANRPRSSSRGACRSHHLIQRPRRAAVD